MDWKLFALFTPLLFVAFQALSKLLPKDIPIFLVYAYASLIGFLCMLSLHLLTANKKSLALETKYIALAAAIGLLIALGNTGIIKAYALGAPQSLFTVLFYVALIVYGIIVGLIFWHEKLHGLQILGMLMAVVGLFVTVYFRDR